MADMYVDDGGSNTSPYDTWAKAATKLNTAVAAQVAGGIVWVGSDHTETENGLYQIPGNGTLASPVTIISADNTSGEPPTYEDMMTGGGSINAGAGQDLDFTSGYQIYIGFVFTSGDDLLINEADNDTYFYNCNFEVADNTYIGSSNGDSSVFWSNCELEQTTAGNIQVGSKFHWRGGKYSWNGGSVSNYLFGPNGSRAGVLLVEGVDFQDLDAGDSLCNIAVNTAWEILFKRCKIPAPLGSIFTGTPSGLSINAKAHSVLSSDAIHQIEEINYRGSAVDDVAVYRAATYDGTNEYSIKLVSTAGAQEYVRPFRFKLADLWCAANPTLTIELNTDNVTLQNDEFWIEIEYPDGTTGALGQIDRTSRAATVTTTPANLTGSAAAWTEALGTEVPQKIEETISGGQAGIHTVWACLAKPSTTVYVCPKIDVS